MESQETLDELNRMVENNVFNKQYKSKCNPGYRPELDYKEKHLYDILVSLKGILDVLSNKKFECKCSKDK